MLTSKGLKFSKEVDQLMKQLQIAFEKDIPEEDLQKFYQTIKIIAKNINEIKLTAKEG
ncbi:MAG: hypothetical protein LUG46_08490 [Erysipelotrichaceae bacterium]|nr:hypothetical protein [Erysipelotrichaceae bacterium]